MLQDIENDSRILIDEFLGLAKLEAGNLFVLGCSTSEVAGEMIGSHSSLDIAKAIYDVVVASMQALDVSVCVQCCEHLNRAIIIEKDEAIRRGLEIVSVVPHPEAGGAMATYAYSKMANPVVVEFVKADAGIDIGGVLIGMALKHVAVPIHLTKRNIFQAHVQGARVRPKYIGGARAKYQ
ncbi:MAG: TIGR01440 family protein [Erysipelotrichaceae bacterium]|nr:TIGR01440 family protein [Erysipelotrichaceae bacterium]MDD3810277.1 TIGR01440 family protein [Erysipelotrichaceae bacterium]